MPELRMGTLNVWGRIGDWPARRAVLAEGFALLQLDLVALQETVVDEGNDQVTEILEGLPHIIHYHRREEGMGISIANRWPMRSVHELRLDSPPASESSFPATALVAEVEVPGPVGAVLFANHFPSYRPDQGYEGEIQAVAVARHLERRAGEDGPHVIVAGDLDADFDAASVRFWTGRQSLGGVSVCYRDAWESAHPGQRCETFSSDNPLVADAKWDWPFREIDHILVRCAEHGEPTLKVRSCDRVFDATVDGV